MKYILKKKTSYGYTYVNSYYEGNIITDDVKPFYFTEKREAQQALSAINILVGLLSKEDEPILFKLYSYEEKEVL